MAATPSPIRLIRACGSSRSSRRPRRPGRRAPTCGGRLSHTWSPISRAQIAVQRVRRRLWTLVRRSDRDLCPLHSLHGVQSPFEDPARLVHDLVPRQSKRSRPARPARTGSRARCSSSPRATRRRPCGLGTGPAGCRGTSGRRRTRPGRRWWASGRLSVGRLDPRKQSSDSADALAAPPAARAPSGGLRGAREPNRRRLPACQTGGWSVSLVINVAEVQSRTSK